MNDEESNNDNEENDTENKDKKEGIKVIEDFSNNNQLQEKREKKSKSLDNEEYIFKKVHADDYKLVDYKEFSKIFDKKNKCKSLNKIIK